FVRFAPEKVFIGHIDIPTSWIRLMRLILSLNSNTDHKRIGWVELDRHICHFGLLPSIQFLCTAVSAMYRGSLDSTSSSGSAWISTIVAPWVNACSIRFSALLRSLSRV